MTKFSKNLYIVGVLVIIIGGFFILSKKSAEAPVEKNIPVVLDNQENTSAVEKAKAPTENIGVEKNIPDKILISVPFATQAPFANWDGLHEEACEEASLIMLKYYLDGKKLTPDIAENEIQRMVDFEIKNYGDFKDTTAAETVKLAEDFYGIKNLKVVYDFPKEDLKKYLAEGNPIIVPAAGRELGNPNFTGLGPLYHNLVLVGYKGNTIVTNDPGTRKGEGYTYNMDVLYNAIHDFPGRPEDINQGRKAMIVVEK
ncbi:MAG: C39 family peptidase [Parcubacteria group bacterium]